MSGSQTPATVALTQAGIWFRTHEYVHDPAVSNFGAEAAAALGVDEELVHKTLLVSFDLHGRSAFAVAVVPVSSMLDLKAMAAAVGVKKVEMAKPADAERVTGYVVGGISPLGQRKLLPTVVDEDAEIYDSIFISGGRRGLDIEVNGSHLATLLNAVFAPLQAHS